MKLLSSVLSSYLIFWAGAVELVPVYSGYYIGTQDIQELADEGGSCQVALKKQVA